MAKDLYAQIQEEEKLLNEEDVNNVQDVEEEVASDEEETEEQQTTEEDDDAPEEGGQADAKDSDDAAKQDEEQPEEVVADEQKPSNSDFARLRREKAAAEKQLKEFQERLQRLEQGGQNQPNSQPQHQNQAKQDSDPEPDKNHDYADWLEWKDRQIERKVAEFENWRNENEQQRRRQETYNAAVREFESYENAFKQSAPDYENAASFLRSEMKRSMRLTLGLDGAQLENAVNQQLLQRAAQYAARGLNPAEELYHFAKDNGYAPQQQQQAPQPNKPNLHVVQKNKTRSANGLSGNSGSPASYTLEEVSNMPLDKLLKLDEEQPGLIQRLEAGF